MGKTAAVRYWTRTGHSVKLAEAIAEAAGCEAKQIPEPVDEPVDILFLGSAVYWGSISKEVHEYLHTLDKSKIGEVVVFSNSAGLQRAHPQITEELQQIGIPVAKENFYCFGEFTAAHRGRPNDEDAKEAQQFVKKMMGEE